MLQKSGFEIIFLWHGERVSLSCGCVSACVCDVYTTNHAVNISDLLKIWLALVPWRLSVFDGSF